MLLAPSPQQRRQPFLWLCETQTRPQAPIAGRLPTERASNGRRPGAGRCSRRERNNPST
jgi:hypothetical protein